MTIVIPCAGLGSRLGEETKYINKAMTTVGQKPAFSYIFDQFSDEDEFIVLLGYKGKELESAIKVCYPYRNIEFVEVDQYAGEGSGLGHSLSCARELLQKPFVFWACDTIINSNIDWKYNENTEYNYVVTTPMLSDHVGLYRAVKESGFGTSEYTFLDKNEVDPDNLDLVGSYVGVAIIHDYEEFWRLSDELPGFTEGGEYIPLSKMKFKCISIGSYVWFDIGNRDRLEIARKQFKGDGSKIIMPKPKEAIWFIDGYVIKFHIDEKFISKRVERALKGLLSIKMQRGGVSIPDIGIWDTYAYRYKEVEGVTLSTCLDPVKFEKLVNVFFLENTFLEGSTMDAVKFVEEFYIKKTINRINEYLNKHKWLPNINGRLCEKPLVNLSKVDEVLLKTVRLTKFCHGDFHLENILYSDNGTFTLLDWRQGFVDGLDLGDQCYDLAKMLHSLIVNHHKVREGKFKFEPLDSRRCILDIDQSEVYSQCRDILRKVCNKLDIDFRYIELLTAIIFLNIAPCHEGDGVYPDFVFHLGAYLLDVIVEELEL